MKDDVTMPNDGTKTPLTRPGPCAYCDHNPVMAERGLCVGVETSAGHTRLYECKLLREWWDAGAAFERQNPPTHWMLVPKGPQP